MTPRSAVTVAMLCTGLLGASASDGQQAPAGTAAGASTNPLDTVPDKMPFDIPYGAPISLDRANVVIAAAVAEARKHDWKLNVAVLDSGGNLVSFQRMDGAQLASIQIAQDKARSSVTFRRETKAFENAIQGGNTYTLSLHGVVGSRGGIPLVEGGRVVGAIGCSGGTGSQDEVVCKAGAAALKP